MPKTKISEFDSTAANNTDIDGINLAEGMLPSDVNNAIRELMAQLKDFQTGAGGDSFNGPIGSTTAVSGAFTTVSATGDVSIADKIVHTGDTNTAIRFPAADTVTVETSGAERLRIDTSGNVGIGTSSPAQILESSKLNSGALSTALSLINPAGNVSGTGVELRMAGTSVTSRYAYIQATASNGVNGHWLRFGTNANAASPQDQMIIYHDGNIGTRASIELGNLASSDQTSLIDFHSVANGATDYEARIQRALGANGALQIINTGTGDFRFQNIGAAPMIFDTSNTERMRITSAGDVSIGTSTAVGRLTVETGSTVIASLRSTQSAVNAYVESVATQSNSSAGFRMDLTGAGARGTIRTVGDSAIVFLNTTSDTERMRIDSSGNLLVNRTSRLNNGKVEALASTSEQAFVAQVQSNGNSLFQGFNATGSLVFYAAGDGYLYTSGTVNFPGVYTTIVGGTNRDVFVDNSGNIGYVSSVRASKTDIQNITDTSWLHQLNPVSFKYRKKDKEGNYTEEADGDIQYGLIAEDVEQVRPDLCFYDIVDGKQELRGVQYSKLTIMLLKAIQEQQAMIEELKAEVALLKSK